MNKQRTIKGIWRDYLEKSFNITIPIIAILAALLVSGILILVWGSNPFNAYAGLISGSLGNSSAIATTILRAMPLLFTGLAVAYGYRGGFFNVGGNGQLYMGAYAAVWITTTFLELDGFLLFPLAILASMLFGAIMALVPAILKAYRGINEVLSLLLLNYVAIQFIEWAIRVDHYMRGATTLWGGKPAVWTWINWIGIKDAAQPHPKSMLSAPQAHIPSIHQLAELFTNVFGDAAWFQQILGSPAYNRITLAVLIAIFAVFVMYFISFRSTIGYKSRAVGINPKAARSLGIDIKQTIIRTAVISGALCGIAGGIEVLGNQYRIIPNFIANAGFEGISVALIGQLHPFGVLLSSVFFGGLKAGTNKMAIVSEAPVAVSYIIQALTILFALIGTTYDVESMLTKRRLKLKRETEGTDTQNIDKEVSNA